MQRLGFIHDMMDVKVLILWVTAHADYPLSAQEIYELCYQDDCLSYFDVCTAVPEMVSSGHLQVDCDSKYLITDKGRQDCELTADSIAFTVKQRAENAVAQYNRKIRRSSFVKTQVMDHENGDFSAMMSLDDEKGNIMTLELMAPDKRQALRFSKLFETKAEELYSLMMMALLDGEDDEEM